MKKQSDIQSVKSVALAFLNLPVEETDYSPIVVMHPIFENGFAGVKIDDEYKMVNILESEENLNIAKKVWEDNINRANSIMQVYAFMRKSYRLTFLKYIEPYLSKKDMAELLADAWVSSENPNQDVNVSIPMLTKWFRKADKRSLMVSEDYKVYTDLEPEFVVYRGVAVGRNPDGLSWTMNYDKAEWFANRFTSHGKEAGYVFKAIAKKEDVFAYFNTRGEEEIVINPKTLTNIQKM